MSENSTYPHQDLLNDNKVVIAELPAKTQTLLEKFKAETDNDKKDAMDETLYGQIEDFLEDKIAKAKAEETKKKVAAHKEKKKTKLDVSAAATAKTPEQEAAEKAAKAKEEKDKNPGLIKKFYGIGS